MAGASGGRSLEQTPTWAVATVCFGLVLISIIIEYIIHLIGKWFQKKHKRALYEALEKIKSELMLLGFISLLLTVGQSVITDICIPKSAANTWHPCGKKREEELSKVNTTDEEDTESEHRRRLLAVVAGSGGSFRRVLATAASTDKCTEGKVPFMSSEGIHQLHIFIFVLAVFHVLYCVLTLALGRAKMRSWKKWEKETRSVEYQFSHDPERFRFARETSFGRRHLSFWTKTPVLVWIVCFFRQFVRSVPKVDYLTLRHGFIMKFYYQFELTKVISVHCMWATRFTYFDLAHLAPQSQTQFDFQKYINRSLEEDFKVVVGISPPIWLFAVIFLLFNTHGWYSYLWLPFIPLIVILLVGTKLHVIITKMGLRIQEGGEVLKGVPLVQPGDHLFWFNRPRLILYLINFVLFQNAFQLAFLAWSWYEFTIKSCFHENIEGIIIRITTGVLIQILCSYVTLPLYALVTQMGSNLKPTIFNEKVVEALRNWHHTAKKHVKHNKGSVTPMSSRTATPSPSHHASPIYLLRNHRSDMTESYHMSSPRRSVEWETDSPSPSYPYPTADGSSSHHHLEQDNSIEYDRNVNEASLEQGQRRIAQQPQPVLRTQHEIDIIRSREFSFDKRESV